MTSSSSGSWLPLKDVCVLDFSLLLPGPFGTLALADLGADVIKIEPPGGDNARIMPMKMFRMANRNKRSIVLDLKRPEVGPVIERLARRADVVIEGFRPGVPERLGIDYDTLRRINPRLVYCSLSGYGQTGPERMHPGHDLNYLAAAGTMMLQGHWLERPRRSGLPIADLAGGSYAAIAILAALVERNRTGQGVQLDLSLTEAAMSYTAIRHGVDLEEPSRLHLYPTNDLFQTADERTIAFGIVEQKFWDNFLAAVSDLAPDLADPKYADEPGRRRHGDELSRRIQQLMLTRSAADWMPLFTRHDVPAQIVLWPGEASRLPQIVEREMIMERDGERHIPFPVRADGRRGARLAWPAPELGAHSDEVLSELGFGPADIAGLRNANVLGPNQGD